MSVEVFDQRVCQLGEGPLWHPLRQQLFWFNILEGKLLSQHQGLSFEWTFDEMVSAAGWIDHDHLLIASASKLIRFCIETGKQELACYLEKDLPNNRSNDGRADSFGGFWIGTMGLKGEYQAGSIYRYYQGELKKIFYNLTITNSICFSPDKRFAFFSDTAQHKVWRQKLDAQHGWPEGGIELFLDFSSEQLNPDGAVCDTKGNIWIAFWGNAQVKAFDQRGKVVEVIELPVKQPSCPAFCGYKLDQLYITSATQGMNIDQLRASPASGQVIRCQTNYSGQQEHQVFA